MGYELIVIGAGPAGLAAALDAAYLKLKTLVIDAQKAGGALVHTYPWKHVDSYINDKPFYDQAVRRLRNSGWATGFSISEAKGGSSCAFNFGEQGFVHMGAVVEDHGAWDDFREYMACGNYAGLPSIFLPMFPIMARIGNRRVERIRAGSGAAQ